MTSTRDIPTFEQLYKTSDDGPVRIWNVEVLAHDDGTASIAVTHGQIDGKQTPALLHIKEGKNIGKKNETSALEQAIKEAKAKWDAQRDRHLYGLTEEESTLKRLYAPMLAQSWVDKDKNLTSYAKNVDWSLKEYLYVQRKLDGNRCLARMENGQIVLFSREGVRITTCDHVVDALKNVMTDGMTLDGELYTHGVHINKISGYIRKFCDATLNLKLCVYDVHDITKSFPERLAVLNSLAEKFAGEQAIELVETFAVSSVDELNALQAQFLGEGYEGAMLRHGKDKYMCGKRSGCLLKVKSFMDDKFVIVGCRSGNGLYENAAVFHCMTADNNPFDLLAAGSLARKREIFANPQPYIGKRVAVKFAKWTETENPVPFQPVAFDKFD